MKTLAKTSFNPERNNYQQVLMRHKQIPVSIDGTTASIPIIYITSSGHSGSTLLDLLLSSHSSVVSVGELKELSDRKGPGYLNRQLYETSCTCGARTVMECEFWIEVEQSIKERNSRSLDSIDTNSKYPHILRRDTRVVLEAVRNVCDCRFIVDSSKNFSRLRVLLASNLFDIRPVHLVRSPLGVVYSNMKKGRPLHEHASMYLEAYRKTREVLQGVDHLTVYYDDLAKNPFETVAQILTWVGLSFEPGQKTWREQKHHNVGGNVMRYDRSDLIALDDSWKKGLSLIEKLEILKLTLPATWARIQQKALGDRSGRLPRVIAGHDRIGIEKSRNNSIKFPNFVCIGAQKAGTSWLNRNVRNHPGIWMTPIKEVHYFDDPSTLPLIFRAISTDKKNARWRRHIKRLGSGFLKEKPQDYLWWARFFLLPRTDRWYGSLFSPKPGQITGEATPKYGTLAPSVVARVKHLMPDLKIIYILRNPLDQIWSAAAMEFDKRGSGLTASTTEKELKSYFESRVNFSHSDYLNNLQVWETYYPNQILVAFFDDLIADPKCFLRNIYHFLELDIKEEYLPDAALKKQNTRDYPPISDEVAAHLARHYHELLQQLNARFNNQHTQNWLTDCENILSNQTASNWIHS